MWQPINNRIMLTLLLSVAVILLFSILVGRGLWVTYAALTEKINEHQLLIAAVEPLAGSLDREREALELARMGLTNYEHHFNSRLDDGLYLTEIGHEAVKHGVNVNELHLGTVSVLATHFEMPVQITIAGDYRDVLDFLQSLTAIANHTEITEMTVRDAYVPPVRSSSRSEVAEDSRYIREAAGGMVVAKVFLVVSTGLDAEVKELPGSLEQTTIGRPNSFIQPFQ